MTEPVTSADTFEKFCEGRLLCGGQPIDPHVLSPKLCELANQYAAEVRRERRREAPVPPKPPPPPPLVTVNNAGARVERDVRGRYRVMTPAEIDRWNRGDHSPIENKSLIRRQWRDWLRLFNETAFDKADRTGKPVDLGHTIVNPSPRGPRPEPPPPPPRACYCRRCRNHDDNT